MRRTVAVIGVAGALVLGQTAVAGPAAAKRNCTFDPTTQTYVCTGGTSETDRGGGGAGNRSVPGESFSGGGGVPGGGFGEHCDYTTQRCVGSNHHP